MLDAVHNMKKSILILSTLCLLLFSAGCERELKIELPAQGKPELNIYGFLYAGEPTLLMLSQTAPYNLPKSSGIAISEASVKYYINGALVEERTVMRQDPKSSDQLYEEGVDYEDLTFIYARQRYKNTKAHLWYKSKCRPAAGDQVRIEVSSPGLPTALFEVIMPPAPEVKGLKVEEVELKSDPFLLEEARMKYESELAFYQRMLGGNAEEVPAPAFNRLVDMKKGLLVSFEVPSDQRQHFYALGAQVPMHFLYDGGGIDDYSKAVQFLVHNLLFDLGRLQYVERDLSFPVRAREIARQRLNEHDQPGYFQPYFTTQSAKGSGRVSLLLVCFGEEAQKYGVDGFNRLTLSALSKPYADVAEIGYGILKSRSGGVLSDVELDALLAEYTIERCNLKHALGFIYVATPIALDLEGSKQ